MWNRDSTKIWSKYVQCFERETKRVKKVNDKDEGHRVIAWVTLTHWVWLKIAACSVENVACAQISFVYLDRYNLFYSWNITEIFIYFINHWIFLWPCRLTLRLTLASWGVFRQTEARVRQLRTTPHARVRWFTMSQHACRLTQRKTDIERYLNILTFTNDMIIFCGQIWCISCLFYLANFLIVLY